MKTNELEYTEKFNEKLQKLFKKLKISNLQLSEITSKHTGTISVILNNTRQNGTFLNFSIIDLMKIFDMPQLKKYMIRIKNGKINVIYTRKLKKTAKTNYK